MARPLRVEYPGAVYHVTSRGNGGDNVFREDADRTAFLEILCQTADRYGWLCHAYCLMDNHYHLLLETPDANLSKGMRQLNGVYTQYVNRRLNRSGHLFQGRFKAILLEKETHLLEVSRYVVLNPLRAGMTSSVDEWSWSSYRGTVGLDKPLPFLVVDWLLSHFGNDRATAVRRYRQFIADGINAPGTPMAGVKGQVLLGSPEFRASLTPLLTEAARHREIPLSQRRATRPDLESLIEKGSSTSRNELICRAVVHWGYSQREVADFLGLHYSTISRIMASLSGKGVEVSAVPLRKTQEISVPPISADESLLQKKRKQKNASSERSNISNAVQQLSLF